MLRMLPICESTMGESEIREMGQEGTGAVEETDLEKLNLALTFFVSHTFAQASTKSVNWHSQGRSRTKN